MRRLRSLGFEGQTPKTALETGGWLAVTSVVLTIVVHEKGGKTQRFPFEGDQFSVGRLDDNDLWLDRANVSSYHLRLRRLQGSVEVLDLESTNGTYVNGRRIRTPRRVRRSARTSCRPRVSIRRFTRICRPWRRSTRCRST